MYVISYLWYVLFKKLHVIQLRVFLNLGVGFVPAEIGRLLCKEEM